VRNNFKIVNSRNVKTIGYDEARKICVIHYNHVNSGKTIYYHIEPEEFDKLMASNDIARDAKDFKTWT
jgi:hypothetical protein